MAAPLLAAGIAAGASLLGTGAQVYAAGKMNKKTRQWNEKMYNIQRQDALTDWNNINQYNSPEEQMKRLKNAGLNPNLVYDNGATTTAAPVRSSDTGSWHPQAPDYSGIGNAASAGISAYYDTQVKNQQIENLKTSNAVMEADKALKEAQAINLGASTSKSLFDLDMGKTLASTTIEAAKANLQKVLADTENTQTSTSQTRQNMALALSANERAEIKQGMDLKEAAVRILKMRQEIATSPLQRAQIQAQIDNVNQDTRIKKLSENLKSLGIESSDNFFIRALGQLLGGSKGMIDKAKSWFNLK